MATYASIQHHIDKGRGIAAKHLGPPFSAYRVEAGNSGDWPSGWTLVSPSFPLFRRRFQSESKAEISIKAVAQWYELIGNMEPFVLGDVFLQIDPAYVPRVSYGAGATAVSFTTVQFNGICLAWHPPVNKSLGARLDRRAQIYRPSADPALLLADNTLYWKSTFENDQPLVLTNGVFAFGPPGSGSGSFVPIGLISQHRNTNALFTPQTPGVTDLKPSRWMAYVPPLPGWSATEGDAIVCEDGSRFVISSPYAQEAGVVGNQLLIERKISQVA